MPPWVTDPRKILALKGHHNIVVPFQGKPSHDVISQGVALGWLVQHLWCTFDHILKVQNTL